MAIRAVVFDVGNVLELSEDNYVSALAGQAARLGLTPGEFAELVDAVSEGGDIGSVTLQEVHGRLGEALGIDEAEVNEIMETMWREYLGTANTAMTEWARGLRPGTGPASCPTASSARGSASRRPTGTWIT
jgi:putative hydrolase of the HAD superfamily